MLLPLLLLNLGFGSGGWYCADGTRCEPPAALACCCGCPEQDGAVAHQCEDEPSATLLAADACGCYYDGASLDAVSQPGRLLAAHPAALTAHSPEVVAPTTLVALASRPAPTGSPPRYLVSPGEPRAPPAA